MSFRSGKWNDIIIFPTGLGSGVAAPARQTIVGVCEGIGFGRGDYIYGQFEVPHDYKEGTDFRPHIHWTSPTEITGNCAWVFSYSCANVNGVFPTATPLLATSAVSGTVLTHLLKETASTISGTGRKIGDIITFKLERANANDTLANTQAAAVLLSIGLHYESDSNGSNQVASKN